MKLYVKNIIREPNDTLYTFLKKVLRFNDGAFAQGTVNATYLDPEFKKYSVMLENTEVLMI